MGQYYLPVVGDESGNVVGVYSTDYVYYVSGIPHVEFGGAKLMEHSWWNCNVPNGISEMIHNNPMRVAWIGDYADLHDYLKLGQSSKVLKKLIKRDVWENCAEAECVEETDFRLDFKYLVNHTLNQFVDLKKYMRDSKHCDGIIHPLPLLTAMGNGKGMGDYRDEYVNSNLVGKYAWHVLSVVDKKPQGMTEFEVFFKED